MKNPGFAVRLLKGWVFSLPTTSDLLLRSPSRTASTMAEMMLRTLQNIEIEINEINDWKLMWSFSLLMRSISIAIIPSSLLAFLPRLLLGFRSETKKTLRLF